MYVIDELYCKGQVLFESIDLSRKLRSDSEDGGGNYFSLAKQLIYFRNVVYVYLMGKNLLLQMKFLIG